MNERLVRDHLVRLLDWEDAHVGFETAVAGIPEDFRGKQPAGAPYSVWQLLEHLRLSQFDILEFCRNPSYRELKWPDDYWPPSSAPGSSEDWNRSISEFKSDRKALQALASDASLDLTSRIPHGSGQTYFRELILAADHAAYHIGEIVLVRRLLGIWPARI